MKLPRLAAIARAVIALAALLIASGAIAQPNYPDKPIRLLAQLRVERARDRSVEGVRELAPRLKAIVGRLRQRDREPAIDIGG